MNQLVRIGSAQKRPALNRLADFAAAASEIDAR